MLSTRLRASLLAVAVAACSALLAFGDFEATAAPASDSQGYVDSTARCASPSTLVLFGSTSSSRVAICKSPDGTFQYRGVRVVDGARLILPARQSSTGAYTAAIDGISYSVTSSSLTVTSAGKTVRDESWVDFHGPTTTRASAGTSAPASVATATATATVTATATPTAPPTPLPPPLPAEVGGSGGR